jgi:hypothetical protein
MKEMVRHAPLPDRTRQSRSLWMERPDGVHVSHDKMESYLQPYGSSEALTSRPQSGCEDSRPAA